MEEGIGLAADPAKILFTFFASLYLKKHRTSWTSWTT